MVDRHFEGPLTMTADSSVTVAPNVLFGAVGEEAVLLDAERGIYFGLNEIGAKVWAALVEGQTVATILARLLKEYDVSPEMLWANMRAVLSQLAEHGLIAVDMKG